MSKKIVVAIVIIFAIIIGVRFINKSDQAKKTETKPIDSTATAVPAINHNKLIGVWYDESIKSPDGGKVVYEIIAKDEQFFIQAVSFKGENLKVSDMPEINDGATELKAKGEEYTSVENPKTSFKIDKHGDLYIFDAGKLMVKCSRIM